MAQMQCANPACRQPVEASVEQPRIFNLPTVTMIVVEHSAATVCVKCGQTQVPIVQTVGNMAVALAPMQPKNLVVPVG